MRPEHVGKLLSLDNNMTQPHTHKYNIPAEIKVKLHDQRQDTPTSERGIIVGVDTIKVFECKCGDTKAYDLERLIT